ncbi:hypothetical protein L0Y59_02605 [Candidatus Uhrbacteria bacterium]|nr:hypothetical protein [Candidatus Uhrbacteria bacterium]
MNIQHIVVYVYILALGACVHQVDVLESEDACDDFEIVDVQLGIPSNVDGTVYEGVRDVYTTFSLPAWDVRLRVSDTLSGTVVTDVRYAEMLYSPGQTRFALMTSDLAPSTVYAYTVSGIDPDSGCDASYSGAFQTVAF